MSEKSIIALPSLGGLAGLIFHWPTGVVYSNQTGGVACHHPTVEGAFTLLDDLGADAVAELEDGPLINSYRTPIWKRGGVGPRPHPLDEVLGRPKSDLPPDEIVGWRGLSDDHADWLDAWLTKYATAPIRVDRSRLSDSEEAWVWVIVGEDESDWRSWAGFSPTASAVLTWGNSD